MSTVLARITNDDQVFVIIVIWITNDTGVRFFFLGVSIVCFGYSLASMFYSSTIFFSLEYKIWESTSYSSPSILLATDLHHFLSLRASFFTVLLLELSLKILKPLYFSFCDWVAKFLKNSLWCVKTFWLLRKINNDLWFLLLNRFH